MQLASEVGGPGLVQLLAVDSSPPVRDLPLDEAQDAEGLVDGPLARAGGFQAPVLLQGPAGAIEHEFWWGFLGIEGPWWGRRYCWRGAHSELASVGARKGRDF